MGRFVLALQRRLSRMGLSAQASVPADLYLLRYVTWPTGIFLVLSVLGLIFASIPGAYHLLISSELGLVENGTVLVALFGMVVATQIIRQRARLPSPYLSAWFGLFAVGLFLLAGEEISWGQQWLGWKTPAAYAGINIQKETNLHNLSQLAEEIPKNLLSVSVLVTGLLWPLWPLWARVRGTVPPLLGRTPLRWIWPSAALWPSAVIAFAIRVVERVVANLPGAHVHDPLLKSLKEGSELFMVLFVVLYLVDLRERYCSRAATGA